MKSDIGRAAAVLRNMDPDLFLYPPCGDVLYCHRRVGDADVYFLTNQSKDACHTYATIRRSGEPEVWDPETGEVMGREVRVEGIGTHRLVTFADPGIEGDSYFVRGSVRYEGVGGSGYLEMWSFFADGSEYYSRTLATEGPVGSLSGDSAGRAFEVPFFLNGVDGPDRIEFNVVLPEDGTVWVGPLTLDGFGPSSAWWTERQAGVIGAMCGALAGLSGAVIGILGGRRRGRSLVEGLLWGGLAVGVVAVLAGGGALLASQPRHVWYPLILIGVVLAVVDGALLPTMRRNYAAAELHRMHALDA